MIDLSLQVDEKELTKILDESLTGSKILGIFPPTRSEHIFVLRVEYPNSDMQDIEFGATELGWWVSPPFVGKHRLMRVISHDGKACDMCSICREFSDDEDFNPNTCKGDL